MSKADTDTLLRLDDAQLQRILPKDSLGSIMLDLVRRLRDATQTHSVGEELVLRVQEICEAEDAMPRQTEHQRLQRARSIAPEIESLARDIVSPIGQADIQAAITRLKGHANKETVGKSTEWVGPYQTGIGAGLDQLEELLARVR